MSNQINNDDDPQKIVDDAIARMMAGTVVKEEKRSNFVWIVVVGIAIAIIVLVLSIDFKYQIPRDASTGSAKKEIELVQDRYGHYYAKGKINGIEVNFVVDTGATSVAIPESVAHQLGLVKGQQVTSSTANGVAVGSYTLLKKVELGSISRYSVDAVILPGMQSGDVLLGMSFLKNLKIVQNNSKMVITQQ